MNVSATPAGPTFSGGTDSDGDPIVLTGSGMALAHEHLIVLHNANRARLGLTDIRYNNFPAETRELQRDHMLSADEVPAITEYGVLALEMARWVG